MRPGTGILPLIPDYISFETGLFVMASKKSEQFSFELGGRYDYLDQRVATISRDVVPRKSKDIIIMQVIWVLLGEVTMLFSNGMNLSYNLGLASRNPGINERYSNGLASRCEWYRGG